MQREKWIIEKHCTDWLLQFDRWDDDERRGPRRFGGQELGRFVQRAQKSHLQWRREQQCIHHWRRRGWGSHQCWPVSQGENCLYNQMYSRGIIYYNVSCSRLWRRKGSEEPTPGWLKWCWDWTKSLKKGNSSEDTRQWTRCSLTGTHLKGWWLLGRKNIGELTFRFIFQSYCWLPVVALQSFP